MRMVTMAAGSLLLSTSIASADLAQRGSAAVTAWSQSAASFAAAAGAAGPEPPSAPDPAAVDKARAAFRDLVLRWQAARPWLVGPGAAVDLPSAVWFWPDPHGSAARQISKALASGEPHGIAPKGLGMAEEILFDELKPGQPDDKLAIACRLLKEVGQFQEKLARDSARAFMEASLSENDRRRLLLISMRDTLDRISQEKIARPLGLDIDTARGQRAEAWQSGLSLATIGAALDGVQAIYLPPDGIEALLLEKQDGAALDRMIQDQFARTRNALDAVHQPLDQAVADPAGRPEVEALLREVQQLRLLVVERLAPALGIGLGFNALDGD
jgi:predicted lipoprotein